jgi:competence protein ComEC
MGALSINYWKATGVTEGNDASCAIQVLHRASGTEWILPGDITKAQEPRYLENLSERDFLVRITTRVVVAPHHGSKTSSSLLWVEALRPDIVIYSAGYRHRYGHPHRDVTARYRQVGTHQLNTACSGLLNMTIEANKLIVNEVWQTSPFWISGEGLTRSECQIR